jgi:hypothetical protein
MFDEHTYIHSITRSVVRTLYRNPCYSWFCSKARQNIVKLKNRFCVAFNEFNCTKNTRTRRHTQKVLFYFFFTGNFLWMSTRNIDCRRPSVFPHQDKKHCNKKVFFVLVKKKDLGFNFIFFQKNFLLSCNLTFLRGDLRCMHDKWLKNVWVCLDFQTLLQITSYNFA